MTEITVCKVVNKANEKEELTVAAKWSNLKLKLTIFKTDNTVLAGEASLKVNEAIPSNSMKEDTSAIGIEEQITHKLDSDSAPSISIDNLTSTIGDDEETPDFFSNETECEIELKLEDEKADDYLKSSANEEISSEEMF